MRHAVVHRAPERGFGSVQAQPQQDERARNDQDPE